MELSDEYTQLIVKAKILNKQNTCLLKLNKELIEINNENLEEEKDTFEELTEQNSNNSISDSQIHQTLKNAFEELFSRPPTNQLFLTSPQNQQLNVLLQQLNTHQQIPFKTLRTDLLCSLIKNCCKMSALIPISLENGFRMNKNKYTGTAFVLHQLQEKERETLTQLLKNLNRISLIPGYQMSALNLGIVFAPNLLQNFQMGDEKIIKFLIEFAYEFE
ncbi:RhoGAP_domain-containing protein [Hexamita inflata]|uniref:RhoGAP domain-containing protein n=1 Tax=Hexamita inflata TaxID=28002 RepID=A0AA86RBT2_9EUKA|nr:RhoGAP domain-containing protein [Hexamita inflata]